MVLVVQKKKQTKTVGRRTIKWRRYKDDVAVEYKERVTVKYEELSEEVGGMGMEKVKIIIYGSCREAVWKNTRKGRSVRK